MKSSVSRSPSPNPKVKLFKTTAEVHAEDTSMNTMEQSTGELSLLDYWQMLYLLVPAIEHRPDIIENCLLAVLQLVLQRCQITIATAMRNIVTEWHLWKRTKNYLIWKQQHFSLSTFANEFQGTKLCTMLYRLPLRLSSNDCQEVQQMLSSTIEIYKNTQSTIIKHHVPLSSVDTVTTFMSSTPVPTPMEHADARGQNLYDYGIKTTSLQDEDGGLRKLFSSPQVTPSTSGISWSICAEVAGDSATFTSTPQRGYNVIKLDLYDFKKCMNIDKSNWWKEAIFRSVAVSTDQNDPIQKQAEKLADMIATRLAALNPEKKQNTHHQHFFKHQTTTNYSRFSRNM